MKAQIPAALVALVAATAVLAHDGVKNPAVKARMDAMMEIAAATKKLHTMHTGAVPFDAGDAVQAASTIARQSNRVPDLFENRETDPKSEAAAAIWENFADFEAKAKTLRNAARSATAITSKDDLSDAIARIGQTCKACHRTYKE